MPTIFRYKPFRKRLAPIIGCTEKRMEAQNSQRIKADLTDLANFNNLFRHTEPAQSASSADCLQSSHHYNWGENRGHVVPH